VSTDQFQVRVARIALSVAMRHGFALGGGRALLAHGLVRRPTEDIDLFTDTEGGVRGAVGLVRSALTEAGLDVRTAEDASELADVIEGMDDAFAEIVVSDASSTVSVSLAQLARHRAPVVMDVGPVLHLDDLLGSKACALATRFEVRDYIDVAAALQRGYRRDQLIDMAHEHDRSLTPDDFAAAAQRLDATPDAAFALYGLDPQAIGSLRSRFADWPRS
jgi:Nucleotidyl transferase AbiEii toxin, Type IV TA system